MAKINKLIAFFISVIAVLNSGLSHAELNHNVGLWLQQSVQETGLISLGAGIVKDGKIVAVNSHGLRKKGAKMSVENGDKWHLGSISKSITATMMARLVDKGLLSWDSTVSDFIKSEKISTHWQSVTLRQLLNHTSGAPSNFSISTQFSWPEEGQKRSRKRLDTVVELMTDTPELPPGKPFNYSNAGYTIAAVMAEQASKKSWEDLIREEIFQPLKLNQSGFGPPQDTEGELSQPRGHRKAFGLYMYAVDTKADNTPIIWPAGGVHMPLNELLAYGNEHLSGLNQQSKFISQQQFKQLHQAGLKSYALGWVVKEPTDWSGRQSILWHNGSNTMWYALLVILPGKNAVIAITSNDGRVELAEKTAWQLVKKIATAI